MRQKIYELINAGSIKLNPVEQEPLKTNDQPKINNVAPEGSINFIEEEDDQEIEVNGLFKMEICKPGAQRKDIILSSPANPLIINPGTITSVTKDLQDMHIAVVTNDSTLLHIWRMSEDEGLQNYTITPLIFSEMQ